MELNGKSPHGPVKAGQEGVGFLVNQSSRALGARLTKTISVYGLDTDGYTLVRHLVREVEASPDGVASSHLAHKLNLPPATVLESSRRLERDGWITVSGQGSHLKLLPTRRALSVVPVLVDASRWMLEEGLNGFSGEEIAEFSGYLRRLIRNLDGSLGDDEGPLM